MSPGKRMDRPGPGLESDVEKARTALAYAGIPWSDIAAMASEAARRLQKLDQLEDEFLAIMLDDGSERKR